LRRIVNTLVKNGHHEHDIIWKYSIEKVQRYYDDLIGLEMENTRNDAIKIYRAVSAAVLTEAHKVNKERADAFRKYLDSLDLDRHKKEIEEKKKDPVKNLRGIIPFMG
jgi:hypothetical protein